jgi:hypothetical protein
MYAISMISAVVTGADVNHVQQSTVTGQALLAASLVARADLSE